MAGQLQLTRVNYAKNSYIVVEGRATTNRFFIIQRGKVWIYREVDAITEHEDVPAGPGDIFGVVSTMAGYSCIETAVAMTNVTLLAVEKSQYGDLIRSNTPVALKIIRQFSRRLRTLNEQLAKRALNSSPESDATHVLQVADYYAARRRFNQAFYAYQRYSVLYPNAENMNVIKQKMMKIAPSVKIVNTAYPPDKIERSYPKDSLLFAEGEKGNELFVIRKGSVKISKIVNNQEVVLAVLKPGDIFGEMALLEDKPRAATVEVLEDCAVMAVNRENFESLIVSQPELVSRLTTLMAERIWFIYKQLANTLVDHPLGRMYDALLIQLEKDRISMDTNQAHQFNFGFKELAGMAGISFEKGEALFKRMLLNKRISLVQNKIFVSDASDVLRQTEYYRRVQRINVNRQKAAENQ